MIEGIVRLLFVEPSISASENSKNQGATVHFPVNLGNPHELSVLDIARMVLSLIPNKSKIEFKPLPIDDPRVRRPDIAKAKALLGWEPKIGVERGLSMTINYFKDKLGR
jgi:nucleoside-diphosphate-sugar epimerase